LMCHTSPEPPITPSTIPVQVRSNVE
jgi:hypothetical protein